MLDKVWQAQPGSQELFLRCPLREVCYSGTRGPGKTDAMLMAFAQQCGKGYGAYWRGVIFRREYKHLDDIIARSKRWFFQFGEKHRPKFLSGQGQMKWIWPTGEELLFRAFFDKDDYWDFHGHEYPFIAWEELTGWPSIECYESMMSCNRTSRPGGLPLQIRSSTNPYGVGHNWVKAYFIDPAPYGVPIKNSQGQARVTLFGSVFENKYIDDEYLKTLKSVTDPNKRKAWLFGSWDITSGGMFDDLWVREKHVLPIFTPPPSWRIDRSFDWGSSRPFSVGWWAESDGTPVNVAGTDRHFQRGSIIRMAEWYGCTGKPNEGLKLTATAVAEGIVRRERDMKLRVHPGPADSAIYAVTDDLSIGQNMEKAGVRWLPADKRSGSRKNGWELIRGRLEAAASNADKPGLYVMENCRDFIRTFPQSPRDTKDPDDINCFVAGTLIGCPGGEIAVNQLTAGDMVDTPIGPRKVSKAGLSGISSTVRITLSNGIVLEGTPDHKIYIEGIGLQPMCWVSLGQSVATKESTSWLKFRLFKGLFFGGMKAVDILNVARAMHPSLEPACFTELSGSESSGKFQKGLSSITKTTIHLITALRTFNWSLMEIMRDTTSKSALLPVAISAQSLMLGERASQDKLYLEKILISAVKTLQPDNLRALIVANLLVPSIQAKNSAQTIATQSQVALEPSKKNALSAALQYLSKLTRKKKPGLVVTRVDGNCGEKEVFNLTVEQAHLFYANGVLATNSDYEDHIDDDVRYRCLGRKPQAMTLVLGAATN